MVDLELVRDYYAQQTNEQLIELAKTDGKKISEDALHILHDEFIKRGLDISILAKEIAKKKQDNEAAAITISHWAFAFNEKKNGVPDAEILNQLISKDVDKPSASLIIQRLPDIQYKNQEFEDLISKKCETTSATSAIAMVILFGIGAFLIFYAIRLGSPLIILLAVGFGIGGFFIARKATGELKGGAWWRETITTHPENIVWIKPIIVKHTVGYVLTIFKERQFQLLTKDDLKVTITVDLDSEREILFEGVKHLLPHVHIGYSAEADALYSANPEKFINALHTRGIYTPFDQVLQKMEVRLPV